MRTYRNVKTGVTFTTNSECKGENWQEVTAPAKSPVVAEEKEKTVKTKKGKKEE